MSSTGMTTRSMPFDGELLIFPGLSCANLWTGGQARLAISYYFATFSILKQKNKNVSRSEKEQGDNLRRKTYGHLHDCGLDGVEPGRSG
jgi:hypothetical protein